MTPLFIRICVMCAVFAVQKVHAFCGPCPSIRESGHEVYLLPAVAGASVKVNIQDAVVKGSRAMGGIEYGYQYLKANKLYANLDGAFLATGSGLRAQVGSEWVPVDSQAPIFTWLELKMGYPIANENRLVIPFAGIGWYLFSSLNWGEGTGFESLLVFLSGGIKISPINFKLCRIGLLLEALAPIGKNRSYSGIEVDYNSNQGGMGGKIAIPMSCSMNQSHTLEWRFEPFIVALSFSQQQLVYGASFGLARKF